MKILIYGFIFYLNLFAYSDPSSWNEIKKDRIEIFTNAIAIKESFSETCYKDGHSGYSIGYGNFNDYCDKKIKILQTENKAFKYLSKEQVRKFVKIDKKTAKWLLKKFIIEIYDKLETFELNDISLVNILDTKELLGIVDNIYTRGETNFYKGDFWNKIIIPYVETGKLNCVQTSHILLLESKKTKENQRNAVVSRRFDELLDFTYKKCFFDINFKINILKKYLTINK